MHLRLEPHLFISSAFAQTAPAAAASGGMTSTLTSMLPLVLMFVVLYFLMIRPQQKRQKELKAMLSALKKGDEVSTIGGVVGKIVKADDNFITLSTGTSELVMQRGAVQSILPPGSVK